MKEVVPGLYRGPRCHPDEIVENKIDVVLCLQSGLWDLATNDPYDNFDFHFYDIQVVNIGMSDFTPPEQDAVNRAINTIERSLKYGRRVYIHCKSGVDRTGFVVAAYRMRVQKKPFKEAYEEWVREGRHFWYFWWKYALKKYESSLNKLMAKEKK